MPLQHRWSAQTTLGHRMVEMCSVVQLVTGSILFVTALGCLHSYGCWGAFIGVGFWTGTVHIAGGIVCFVASRVSSEKLLVVAAILLFTELLFTLLEMGMNLVGLLTEIQWKSIFAGDLSKWVEDDWWLRHRFSVIRRHIFLHTTCLIATSVNVVATIAQIVITSRRFVAGKFAPPGSNNNTWNNAIRLRLRRQGPTDQNGGTVDEMDHGEDEENILLNVFAQTGEEAEEEAVEESTAMEEEKEAVNLPGEASTKFAPLRYNSQALETSSSMSPPTLHSANSLDHTAWAPSCRTLPMMSLTFKLDG